MDQSSSKETSTKQPNEKDLVEGPSKPLPEIYILPPTVPSKLRALVYPFSLHCYAEWTENDRFNRKHLLPLRQVKAAYDAIMLLQGEAKSTHSPISMNSVSYMQASTFDVSLSHRTYCNPI